MARILNIKSENRHVGLKSITMTNDINEIESKTQNMLNTFYKNQLTSVCHIFLLQ